jgi:hypothetical protein
MLIQFHHFYDVFISINQLSFILNSYNYIPEFSNKSATNVPSTYLSTKFGINPYSFGNESEVITKFVISPPSS